MFDSFGIQIEHRKANMEYNYFYSHTESRLYIEFTKEIQLASEIIASKSTLNNSQIISFSYDNNKQCYIELVNCGV